MLSLLLLTKDPIPLQVILFYTLHTEMKCSVSEIHNTKANISQHDSYMLMVNLCNLLDEHNIVTIMLISDKIVRYK